MLSFSSFVMNLGEFISIDYVGRLKESGEIFDVTMEEIAKKSDVYNPKVSYKPVNIVVGANFTIKGLDDELKKMKVGDKKTILVEPDNAFGPRIPKLVRPIPLASFKDQEVAPVPGAYVNVQGIRGKILSVDGGRIRVDFNHPLAGKVLEYDLEVKKQITDNIDKIKSIIQFITSIEFENINIKIIDKIAEISVTSQDINNKTKEKIAELIVKWINDITKIKFIEEFDGKTKSENKE